MVKVLLVDDEPDILDEACETLTDEGYDAICAGSVDEALEELRNHPDIGIVVTDLKMPGRNGGDLIKTARQEFERDIAFIIMSGHGSPRVKTNGVDIKKFPFLRKPLDIDEFLEAVETAVSSKDTRDRDGRRE